MNLLGVGSKFPENIPSGIVTKPPKPGFVGFDSTCLGDIREFLGRLYTGGDFSSGSLGYCCWAHRGWWPYKITE
jgi:hypothetical protein